MNVGRVTAAALAAVALAGACSGGSSRPRATPTTPAPTTSATTPAGEALQRLAAATGAASYSATYVAREKSHGTTATWLVWRTRTALRVDVVARHVVATLIITPRGVFSCSRAKHRRACFLVAKPGRPIPAPFNLAPGTVFAADVTALTRNTDDYDVTPAGTSPAGSGGVPAGTCFAIKPLASAPSPRVDPGTYCFADVGVITSITYRSGNTVRLTRVSMRRPPSSTFVPYSSPTPLPG